MPGAYDALNDEFKATIEDLHVHHSMVYSRQVLGYEFTQEEQDKLKGAVHPLVRTFLRAKQWPLYLASHASRVVEWAVPEGRALLRDLS